MTPRELIAALARLGVRVNLKDNGGLRLQGPKSSLAEAADLVKSIKAELIEYLVRLGDRHRNDLDNMVEVERGVWTNPSATDLVKDIISGESINDLVEAEQPQRPPGRLVYGMTKAGRLCELPRKEADELRDPVTHVTAENWNDWYLRTAGDAITKQNTKKTAEQILPGMEAA